MGMEIGSVKTSSGNKDHDRKSPFRKSTVGVLVCLIVVIVLAVVIFVYSQNTYSAKIRNVLKAADLYLSELNYEQAVAYYTMAIEIDPMEVRAYQGRAQAYTELQRMDDAIADYMTIIELLPESPDAFLAVASTYESHGQLGKAIEILQKGIDSEGMSKEDNNVLIANQTKIQNKKRTADCELELTKFNDLVQKIPRIRVEQEYLTYEQIEQVYGLLASELEEYITFIDSYTSLEGKLGDTILKIAAEIDEYGTSEWNKVEYPTVCSAMDALSKCYVVLDREEEGIKVRENMRERYMDNRFMETYTTSGTSEGYYSVYDMFGRFVACKYEGYSYVDTVYQGPRRIFHTIEFNSKHVAVPKEYTYDAQGRIFSETIQDSKTGRQEIALFEYISDYCVIRKGDPRAVWLKKEYDEYGNFIRQDFVHNHG